MKRFKEGDKVKLKMEIIKWYLSSGGQEAFFPPSGVLNEKDEFDHTQMTVIMLRLAMQNDVVGTVIKVNWPHNKETINYRVKIMDGEFNLAPEYLTRSRS